MKMKTTLATLLYVIAVAVSASAQVVSSAKIPARVMSTFKERFPDAEKVSWEVENKKEYEANFKSKGIEQSSSFDENGKWIETGVEIRFSGLPKEVQQTVNTQFAGWKIDEISKASHVQYGLCYEVEAIRGKEKYDVVFSKTGEILSKERSSD
jgi:hypothetical protein